MRLASIGAVAFALLLFAVPTASGQADLMSDEVRFEFYVGDLVEGALALDARCEIVASGEALDLLGGATDGTSVAVAPGSCAITVILFGTNIPIPLANATPLGVHSFYLPSLALVTFGLVDVSVDLASSLAGATRVVDTTAATLEAENHTWTSWGARRVVVHATDAFGSSLATDLETSFAWTVDLSVTVWALSVPLFHFPLSSLGTFHGTPSLRTPLFVDMRPSPLALAGPEDLTHDGATFRWNGTLASDVDHLELGLDDGSGATLYVVWDRAEPSIRVTLRPETTYRAWLVVVDRAGQETASDPIEFHTLEPPSNGVSVQASGPDGGLLLVVAGLVAIVAFAAGRLSRRRR
jgi:hypothetical protein